MSETCPCCGHRVKIGQSQLTMSEKRKYDWAGPNGKPNIIVAQCAKAAAEYYDVNDWVAVWDPTLGVSENVDLMRRHGDGATMREIGPYVR